MSRKIDRWCLVFQISFATPTGVTHRCEDHRCINGGCCAAISLPESTEARLERDKSPQLRRKRERERTIIRFRVVWRTRADRAAISCFASSNSPSPRIVFSPYEICPFSRKAIRYQLSTNLPRVVICQRCLAGLFYLLPLSRSVPCATSITVPLENRYRLDLTITYRDHSTSPAFVKTNFHDSTRVFRWSMADTSSGRCVVNWLLRKESLKSWIILYLIVN